MYSKIINHTGAPLTGTIKSFKLDGPRTLIKQRNFRVAANSSTIRNLGLVLPVLRRALRYEMTKPAEYILLTEEHRGGACHYRPTCLELRINQIIIVFYAPQLLVSGGIFWPGTLPKSLVWE